MRLSIRLIFPLKYPFLAIKLAITSKRNSLGIFLAIYSK